MQYSSQLPYSSACTALHKWQWWPGSPPQTSLAGTSEHTAHLSCRLNDAEMTQSNNKIKQGLSPGGSARYSPLSDWFKGYSLKISTLWPWPGGQQSKLVAQHSSSWWCTTAPHLVAKRSELQEVLFGGFDPTLWPWPWRWHSRSWWYINIPSFIKKGLVVQKK